MSAFNQTQGFSLTDAIHVVMRRRGLLIGLILVTALVSFEIFNYSTTQYALTDLLGDLRFLGIPWATVLSIAFCGIDFAGIARLFTPEQGDGEFKEAWYLFGAWLLAATMNAALTWWGVSIALVSHQLQSSLVINPRTIIAVAPAFVAVMVWLIRVLLIGAFSLAGPRLFTQEEPDNERHSVVRRFSGRTDALSPVPFRSPVSPEPIYHPEPRPVPSYQPVTMEAKSKAGASHSRRG